jgi:hypothetical protein
MKRIIVLLMAVLCAGTLLAQETSSRSKSRFNPDYDTYKKISIGTDFTYDIWQDMPDAIGKKKFNRSSSFFGTYNFKLGKSNFYACPGLGFNFRNIYADALLQRDSITGIAYVPVPLSKKDYKNCNSRKHVSNYIQYVLAPQTETVQRREYASISLLCWSRRLMDLPCRLL